VVITRYSLMLPIFRLILPILPILGFFWPFEGR
jgi:hypothetical protein